MAELSGDDGASARRRHLATVAAAVLAILCLGSGCSSARLPRAAADQPAEVGVGLTRVATSAHYIVVMNVVPPEQMYTPAEGTRMHPTSGELIIHGHMAPIGPDSRHTEAHVYSRQTGRPVIDKVPVITVVDEATGRRLQPEATLMQDIVVGPRDIHFGNNVAIALDHPFSLTVQLGAETMDFNGRL